MAAYLEKTIIVSSPKRSGGTLMMNLFDSHPGIVHFPDEAFFWEHVYNAQAVGQEEMLIDMFRRFDPAALDEAFIDRDLLPWIEGVFQGMRQGKIFEIDLGFDRPRFLEGLRGLKSCQSVSDVWDCLVKSYGAASAVDCSQSRSAFIFGGDWGRSMLATKDTLDNCKGIFIMRHPLYALDSLKKNRLNWGRRFLHPVNFAEVINYYHFFWNNRDAILDDRTILVRFEDLVADPRKTMQAVARHVGVDFTENLVTPTLLGKPFRGEGSFQTSPGVDASAISRKIEALNDTEIGMIKDHLKPLLKYFDYTI